MRGAWAGWQPGAARRSAWKTCRSLVCPWMLVSFFFFSPVPLAPQKTRRTNRRCPSPYFYRCPLPLFFVTVDERSTTLCWAENGPTKTAKDEKSLEAGETLTVRCPRVTKRVKALSSHREHLGAATCCWLMYLHRRSSSSEETWPAWRAKSCTTQQSEGGCLDELCSSVYQIKLTSNRHHTY